MSVSSVGGEIGGFGGKTSELAGAGLGALKNGDTEGVDCGGLNALSNAEGEEVDMTGGWAVKVNGLDVEVPIPKPEKAPNLG